MGDHISINGHWVLKDEIGEKVEVQPLEKPKQEVKEEEPKKEKPKKEVKKAKAKLT